MLCLHGTRMKSEPRKQQLTVTLSDCTRSSSVANAKIYVLLYSFRLVCYTAVFRVVKQRSSFSSSLWGGALREEHVKRLCSRLVFALLILNLREISKYKPRVAYIRRDDLTEDFFALWVWGAYIWRGLFSEFHGILLLEPGILHQISSIKPVSGAGIFGRLPCLTKIIFLPCHGRDCWLSLPYAKPAIRRYFSGKGGKKHSSSNQKWKNDRLISG